MSQSVSHAVLTAHRVRVAAAKTYQEFREAQLDLLDFMISALDTEDAEKRALLSYHITYERWAANTMNTE